MKLLIRTGRILVGIVFIFSGIVKGIDPLGTAYKLSEYFASFRLGFLDNLSLPLSIVLCTVEFITGVLLLTGSMTRLASWMAALFMAVFTPLTIVLYFFNPVSDCGCFGDAIHLTNGQTLLKNIIITLVVVFVFVIREDTTATKNRRGSTFVLAGSLMFFAFFIWYNMTYLPLIDFRPYKPGTDLIKAMSRPEDAPADKYDIRFIYEKDGIQKEFTLSDYPANDSTWKFIDQKSVLISAGYVPPVHDFSLTTSDGRDMTSDILNRQGFTMLMISRKISEAKPDLLEKGLSVGKIVSQNNADFYVVTSSSPSVAEPLAEGNKVLYADETTLKTVVRSDPGFVLLHGATVMAMWSPQGLPDDDAFTGNLDSLAIKSHYDRTITFIILSFILLLLVISSFGGKISIDN